MAIGSLVPKHACGWLRNGNRNLQHTVADRQRRRLDVGIQPEHALRSYAFFTATSRSQLDPYEDGLGDPAARDMPERRLAPRFTSMATALRQ
jgi:hypothetical protein